MSGILQEVKLRVGKDLSGGVRLQFGNLETVMSPEQSVQFAATILRIVGIDLEIQGMPPLLRKVG